MAVFSVVFAVVYAFFGASFTILSTESNRSSLRTNMEGAFTQLSHDLLLTSQVVTIGASSIGFWVDLDYDGNQEAPEIYSYALSGGKIIKTINGVSKNLLYGVTNFTLGYDSALASSVHLVTVTMTATEGSSSLTVQNSIRIRNQTN